MDTNSLAFRIPDQAELNQKLLKLMKQTSENLEPSIIQSIKDLIGAGADVNTRDADGNFPLILAAGNGLKHIVAELISYPDIVLNACDRVDKKGQTALMEAAFYNQAATVRVLLSAQNIDVNKTDSYGQTALMQAADRPESATSGASVTALLSHPCILVNQQNIHGHTALMQALFSHNKPAVMALLKAPGLMINLKNQKGQTAISIAFENGQDEMVKLLKSHGGILPDRLTPKVETGGWLESLKNIFSNLTFSVPALDHTINHSTGSYDAISSSAESKPRVTFVFDNKKVIKQQSSMQRLHGLTILQEGEKPKSYLSLV